MTATIRVLDERPEVRQSFAVITALAGDRWSLRTDDGETASAARALSCLVEPCLGDRVLVALGSGESYVLAVLQRRDVEGVELSAPGNLTVRVADGAFRVAARDGVELASAKDLTLAAARLMVHAAEGNVAVRTLALVGERLHADLGAVRTVARTVDSLLDRFTQRVKRSYRFVEEVDTLQAETVDQTVRETWHLRARHALTHTEKLVKVDSEQIQLG